MTIFSSSAYAIDYNAPLKGDNLTLDDGDKVIYNDKDAGVNIIGINSTSGLNVNGSATIDLNTGGNGSATGVLIYGDGKYNLGTDSTINIESKGGAVFEFSSNSNTTLNAEALSVNFTNTDMSTRANFFHSNSDSSNLTTSLNGSNVELTNVTFVDLSGSNNVLDLGDNTTVNSTVDASGEGLYSSRVIFYVNGDSNTIKANNANISMNILPSEDEGALINLGGSNNTIDLGTGSTLSLNTTNTSQQTEGIIVSGTGNSVLVKDANIDLNIQQNSTAIATSGTGNKVDISGKMNIVGKIEASGQDSKINLDAASGSNFTGSSTVNSGTFDLSMNSSVWQMTDNSQVSNLTLNNSTVKFNNDNFTTLTTDTLNGDGTFDISTDIVGQQGDLIVVNGIAEGNQKLKITNNGSATTDGTETLTVVKTGTNNAKFTLANSVELGGYKYDLRSAIDSVNDVELYSTGESTSTAQSATSFLNISYLTTYIENQTLLQRLGDLRNSGVAGVKSDGFWIKGFGGKLSSFSGSSMKGFDMTYIGTQLGIDKNIDIQDGRLLVGIMTGFTHTNPNYREGDGSGKNYTVGFYATYLNDNGIYVDSVLKYNSMHNQFNVKDTVGDSVKGTGNTQGIMLSAEVGKRFWLENKQQGFYLEPQAQLSYGYQNGDTVHASNGLKVGLSHYNSTLGRISGIVGYQIHGQNPINIYAKTGIVREMSGGASYRFNDGEKNSYTFRSSWFDNGIGANVTINKQHNIYFEADYSAGGKFDNSMMNLGYRYSF